MPTGASRPPIGSILSYSLSRVWYPLWLLPVIIAAVLLPLHRAEVIILSKAVSEPMAPVILLIAFVTAVVYWRRSRHPFAVWLSILLAAFLCRELHFPGTSIMIYLVFFTLMAAGWHQYPRLGDHLGGRLFLSFFSAALVSYLIAVGLDKRWWKFLPGDKYEWAEVEEYVELTGHLALLILAAYARPVINPLLTRAAPGRS